ncbi:hypothetical protein PR048_001106 [Dryococelus australis]|uniref:Uncharacterized protein n=1 Tax=Dryococelus australis TaxID=614101 RepID=A0ABQ9IGF7_9NEOP|nr:hypothetical protein PR048_001106 [Dryococelus australis]
MAALGDVIYRPEFQLKRHESAFLLVAPSSAHAVQEKRLMEIAQYRVLLADLEQWLTNVPIFSRAVDCSSLAAIQGEIIHHQALGRDLEQREMQLSELAELCAKLQSYPDVQHLASELSDQLRLLEDTLKDAGITLRSRLDALQESLKIEECKEEQVVLPPSQVQEGSPVSGARRELLVLNFLTPHEILEDFVFVDNPDLELLPTGEHADGNKSEIDEEESLSAISFPTSPLEHEDDTIESNASPIPVEEVSFPIHTQQVPDEIAVFKTTEIASQTGDSLLEHLKPTLQQVTSKDVGTTCVPSVDVATSAIIADVQKGNIKVMQKTYGDEETIEVATRQSVDISPIVQLDSQKLVLPEAKQDEELLVQVKYKGKAEDTDRETTSELNITHTMPQSFETMIVDPEDTTTEVIVDADGTKRIIVRKVRRTTVSVQQHQPSQIGVTNISTVVLPEDNVEPDHQVAFSKVVLTGQQETALHNQPDDSKVVTTSKTYIGQIVAGIPGEEVVVSEFSSDPQHETITYHSLSPSECGKFSPSTLLLMGFKSHDQIPEDDLTGENLHKDGKYFQSASSVQAVVQQVTRKTVRKVRRVIRHVTVIDGQEHVTEEIVEEPEEIEVTQEGIPRVNIEIKQGKTAPEDIPKEFSLHSLHTSPVIEEITDEIQNRDGDTNEQVSHQDKISDRPVLYKQYDTDTADKTDKIESLIEVTPEITGTVRVHKTKKIKTKGSTQKHDIRGVPHLTTIADTEVDKKNYKVVSGKNSKNDVAQEIVDIQENLKHVEQESPITAVEETEISPLGMIPITNNGIITSKVLTNEDCDKKVMDETVDFPNEAEYLDDNPVKSDVGANDLSPITHVVCTTKRKIIRKVVTDKEGKETLTEEVVELPDEVEAVEGYPILTTVEETQTSPITSVVHTTKKKIIRKVVIGSDGKENVTEEVVELPDEYEHLQGPLAVTDIGGDMTSPINQVVRTTKKRIIRKVVIGKDGNETVSEKVVELPEEVEAVEGYPILTTVEETQTSPITSVVHTTTKKIIHKVVIGSDGKENVTEEVVDLPDEYEHLQGPLAVTDVGGDKISPITQVVRTKKKRIIRKVVIGKDGKETLSEEMVELPDEVEAVEGYPILTTFEETQTSPITSVVHTTKKKIIRKVVIGSDGQEKVTEEVVDLPDEYEHLQGPLAITDIGGYMTSPINQVFRTTKKRIIRNIVIGKDGKETVSEEVVELPDEVEAKRIIRKVVIGKDGKETVSEEMVELPDEDEHEEWSLAVTDVGGDERPPVAHAVRPTKKESLVKAFGVTDIGGDMTSPINQVSTKEKNIPKVVIGKDGKETVSRKWLNCMMKMNTKMVFGSDRVGGDERPQLPMRFANQKGITVKGYPVLTTVEETQTLPITRVVHTTKKKIIRKVVIGSDGKENVTEDVVDLPDEYEPTRAFGEKNIRKVVIGKDGKETVSEEMVELPDEVEAEKVININNMIGKDGKETVSEEVVELPDEVEAVEGYPIFTTVEESQTSPITRVVHTTKKKIIRKVVIGSDGEEKVTEEVVDLPDEYEHLQGPLAVTDVGGDKISPITQVVRTKKKIIIRKVVIGKDGKETVSEEMVELPDEVEAVEGYPILTTVEETQTSPITSVVHTTKKKIIRKVVIGSDGQEKVTEEVVDLPDEYEHLQGPLAVTDVGGNERPPVAHLICPTKKRITSKVVIGKDGKETVSEETVELPDEYEHLQGPLAVTDVGGNERPPVAHLICPTKKRITSKVVIGKDGKETVSEEMVELPDEVKNLEGYPILKTVEESQTSPITRVVHTTKKKIIRKVVIGSDGKEKVVEEVVDLPDGDEHLTDYTGLSFEGSDTSSISNIDEPSPLTGIIPSLRDGSYCNTEFVKDCNQIVPEDVFSVHQQVNFKGKLMSPNGVDSVIKPVSATADGVYFLPGHFDSSCDPNDDNMSQSSPVKNFQTVEISLDVRDKLDRKTTTKSGDKIMQSSDTVEPVVSGSFKTEENVIVGMPSADKWVDPNQKMMMENMFVQLPGPVVTSLTFINEERKAYAPHFHEKLDDINNFRKLSEGKDAHDDSIVQSVQPCDLPVIDKMMIPKSDPNLRSSQELRKPDTTPNITEVDIVKSAEEIVKSPITPGSDNKTDDFSLETSLAESTEIILPSSGSSNTTKPTEQEIIFFEPSPLMYSEIESEKSRDLGYEPEDKTLNEVSLIEDDKKKSKRKRKRKQKLKAHYVEESSSALPKLNTEFPVDTCNVTSPGLSDSVSTSPVLHSSTDSPFEGGVTSISDVERKGQKRKRERSEDVGQIVLLANSEVKTLVPSENDTNAQQYNVITSKDLEEKVSISSPSNHVKQFSDKLPVSETVAQFLQMENQFSQPFIQDPPLKDKVEEKLTLDECVQTITPEVTLQDKITSDFSIQTQQEELRPVTEESIQTVTPEPCKAQVVKTMDISMQSEPAHVLEEFAQTVTPEALPETKEESVQSESAQVCEESAQTMTPEVPRAQNAETVETSMQAEITPLLDESAQTITPEALVETVETSVQAEQATVLEEFVQTVTPEASIPDIVEMVETSSQAEPVSIHEESAQTTTPETLLETTETSVQAEPTSVHEECAQTLTPETCVETLESSTQAEQTIVHEVSAQTKTPDALLETMEISVQSEPTAVREIFAQTVTPEAPMLNTVETTETSMQAGPGAVHEESAQTMTPEPFVESKDTSMQVESTDLREEYAQTVTPELSISSVEMVENSVQVDATPQHEECAQTVPPEALIVDDVETAEISVQVEPASVHEEFAQTVEPETVTVETNDCVVQTKTDEIVPVREESAQTSPEPKEFAQTMKMQLIKTVDTTDVCSQTSNENPETKDGSIQTTIENVSTLETHAQTVKEELTPTNEGSAQTIISEVQKHEKAEISEISTQTPKEEVTTSSSEYAQIPSKERIKMLDIETSDADCQVLKDDLTHVQDVYSQTLSSEAPVAVQAAIQTRKESITPTSEVYSQTVSEYTKHSMESNDYMTKQVSYPLQEKKSQTLKSDPLEKEKHNFPTSDVSMQTRPVLVREFSEDRVPSSSSDEPYEVHVETSVTVTPSSISQWSLRYNQGKWEHMTPVDQMETFTVIEPSKSSRDYEEQVISGATPITGEFGGQDTQEDSFMEKCSGGYKKLFERDSIPDKSIKESIHQFIISEKAVSDYDVQPRIIKPVKTNIEENDDSPKEYVHDCASKPGDKFEYSSPSSDVGHTEIEVISSASVISNFPDSPVSTTHYETSSSESFPEITDLKNKGKQFKTTEGDDKLPFQIEVSNKIEMPELKKEVTVGDNPILTESAADKKSKKSKKGSKKQKAPAGKTKGAKHGPEYLHFSDIVSTEESFPTDLRPSYSDVTKHSLKADSERNKEGSYLLIASESQKVHHVESKKEHPSKRDLLQHNDVIKTTGEPELVRDNLITHIDVALKEMKPDNQNAVVVEPHELLKTDDKKSLQESFGVDENLPVIATEAVEPQENLEKYTKPVQLSDEQVLVKWHTGTTEITEHVRNLQNMRKATPITSVLYVASIQDNTDERPAEQRTSELQTNLAVLQNAVEKRDVVVVKRTIITTVETITTWLETIEYRVYLKQQQTKSVPMVDHAKDFGLLKQEMDCIEEGVNALGSMLNSAEEICNEDDKMTMKEYLSSLHKHVKAIEEVTQENEEQTAKDLKRWEEFLNGVNNISVLVEELKQRLEEVLESESSAHCKFQELDKIEASNRGHKVKISLLLATARGLMNDFPGHEVPPEIYCAHEMTHSIDHTIGLERERLLQFLSLADEYVQTLNEFAQIIDVADALVESTILVVSLEHLQEEMQKHRKFFVNLSHCRGILESLEGNLDPETRALHSELHQLLHHRASAILDKAAGRAQQMALAASRWTVLEQGMKEEQGWLQVAHQRVPDLQTVKSSDYDQYISLYQAKEHAAAAPAPPSTGFIPTGLETRGHGYAVLFARQ